MTVKFLLISIGWIIIIFYLIKKKNNLAKENKWPIGLVLAGSLANGIEIITKGSVFDYIDLAKIGIPWPIFNLADIAIVIGLIWLTYKIIKM